MKKIITAFSFFILSISIPGQTNSVELRDGGGSLISTHASITEAYNAIPLTITQAYLIEILSTYDQSSETIPITLGAKSGGSAANTITIRPAAGSTGKSVSASSTSGILVLNDADYIILDGRPGGVGSAADFKVENLSTSGTNSNTISMLNGASNNIIQYVHVVNNTQNTAGPRAIVLGSTTTTGNDNNLITNCIIEGGRSGIGIAGSSTIPNQNTAITQCEIFNWGYAGIWLLSGALNVTMESNKIYQTAGVNNTIVSGIIMSTIAGGTYNITKNWIYDLRTTSTSTSAALRGIYSSSPAAGSVFNIQNNMISNTLDNINSQTITGIELLGSNAYTANLYYNTVLIGGNHSGGTANATTSAGIRITAASITLNMMNNMAVNKRTGGSVNHIGFVLTNNTGTYDFDFNCYYANGTNSFQAFIGTTGYNDLNIYKSASTPNEQNTIFKDVSFTSLTDLHLVPPSDGDPELAGIPIAGILEDFDGDIRSSTFPYRGADEATIIPVELTSFSASVSENSVTLNWLTATELNNLGFEIQRQNSDDKNQNMEWTKIGFVPGFGTTTEPKSYSFIDSKLETGNYNYRLKQIDLDGSFAYSNTINIKIEQPFVFTLDQNYPNPFNPVTSIQYAIANKQFVKLIVYDVLGNEIAVLVNEEKPAGEYKVTFNAAGLPSGVYLYQLKAGEFNSVRKLVLLK
ncbi:MAG: T9SS type A sorting domain-containing protein [Ignavibacteriota bacterium]|nr:T9SS C-terminal target domain-containing protein [Ignavibacteriota bacterium]MCO6447975.1 T9SS type A sorting domain-containing protein [Ignavibacterium album]QKJ98067.1 MAG: T9SS type A sorting domain-containing protein [Ignavibacteriota bacterium]